MKHKKTLIQFIKYGLVGCLNTGITLAVIFVCKSLLNVNPYIANILGYTAGLINSFLWNKSWVFKSKNGYRSEAMKFLLGFGICYAIQLLVVYLLNTSALGPQQWCIFGMFTLSGYGIATLIGNVAYTLVNFIYNRMVTFRQDY